MKAFKIIGIAIFRDRNLGFEVLGLCNFKCYHYAGVAYKWTKGERLKIKKNRSIVFEWRGESRL